SHSHFDHTGGLRDVLRKMGREVEVVAHPSIWINRYNRRQDKPDRFMGMPFSRQELENYGACFNLSKDPVIINDNIITTGEVPMVTEYEEVGSERFIKEDSGWKPDGLLDDRALIVRIKQGLVIILGCAHRGIINTIYHAQQLTGVERIYAVVGGAHLLNASEERLRLTISALRELGVQKLGLCHCTGMPQTAVLAQEFGDKFFFNNAGTSLELP
ncbi:MBL fold metallo-hydrolase, partial [Chloroflexota bacterium]